MKTLNNETLKQNLSFLFQIFRRTRQKNPQVNIKFITFCTKIIHKLQK